MKRTIAIAIVASNNVVGDGKDQPFKFKEDFERFKSLTTGHPFIIGRKTHEAIGRFLPNRTTIVVTSDPNRIEESHEKNSTGWIVPSVRQALDLAHALDDEVYVGGGGQVWREAWEHLTELRITRVHEPAEDSVTFPEIDPDRWFLRSSEPREKFTFEHWTRI